ncbi:MAG: ferric iron reductase protein FhuF [Paraburkholderia sp.]|jgi:ferric iron reductase protein FhuF|nr:ferric iron reductase protein FhuF [Paraburkholderia sp.]
MESPAVLSTIANRCDPHAQCLAAFAPESIAHYLEHAWLGTPDASDEPVLAEDETGKPIVVAVTELASHRAVLLDAMVKLYGGNNARRHSI